jgi:TolA-binding protein
LETILPRLPAQALKTPRVFTRDLEGTPTNGEDYALASIIKGSFFARNWEAAREELAKFLALPRSAEATARAKFYLGQCFYFLRQPREGIFEFLAIQDRFPTEAGEWVQASLDMMKN